MTTPTRKKPLKVIPGKTPQKAGEYKSHIRVIPLTTSERKAVFARNLDRLIEIVRLSRKDAADETGIDYRVVRRLVTQGVSRADDRGIPDLQRLVKFFCLKEVEELWKVDLLPHLLTTASGTEFVRRFRSQLEARLSQLVAEEASPAYDELALLKVALGQQGMAETTDSEEYQKIAAILSSAKAEQFRCLIDDYFEFVTRNEKPQRLARG